LRGVIAKITSQDITGKCSMCKSKERSSF
jgi:hypothetical protein